MGIIQEGANALGVIRRSSVLLWRDWVVLAALNLAWAVAWVTLILGPPATLALYRAAALVARGEVVDFRELAGTLRRDFFKSWLWFFVTVGVSLVIALALRFYSRLDVGWASGLGLLSFVVGIFWLALGLYVLPYFIEQESQSLRQAFRNALFTLLASPVYTAVLAGAVGLLLLLGSRLPFLFFLGLPCLVALLGTCAVRERLRTFNVRRPDGA